MIGQVERNELREKRNGEEGGVEKRGVEGEEQWRGNKKGGSGKRKEGAEKGDDRKDKWRERKSERKSREGV